MGSVTPFGLIICLMLTCVTGRLQAQPEGYRGVVAGKKQEVLFLPVMSPRLQGTFPKSVKLQQIEELQFTGPAPSHPFLLGHFACDARWGVVNGYLQVIEGKNAALQIAWAEDFELEGIMEQAGTGGWFLLLGWDEGRGFALSNVTMRSSGSPWHLTEFRGGKALEDRSQEFEKFEWKGEQPFRLSVIDGALSFEIGKFRLLNNQDLETYTPGNIILGTYDTRYGPRPLRIKSMRIQNPTAARTNAK